MNENTKSIIKATAPLLKEKGEEITSLMYSILFERHPETKELFKDASEDQYKKLANAVYVYALNIDNLEVLQKGIETMAQVHVKTQIKPEHYPLVGEALLSAIKQVLGDAASEDVIDAWKEAYFFLADVLIKKEKQIYSSVKTA